MDYKHFLTNIVMTNANDSGECNHFVGWLNDYGENWLLYIKDDVIKQCKLYRGDIEPRKLLNSGNARKFKFCPDCGERTDWKKLLTPNH